VFRSSASVPAIALSFICWQISPIDFPPRRFEWRDLPARMAGNALVGRALTDQVSRSVWQAWQVSPATPSRHRRAAPAACVRGGRLPQRMVSGGVAILAAQMRNDLGDYVEQRTRPFAGSVIPENDATGRRSCS
jgi:hypothetical protein